jgi:HEAT repeat protein
MLFQAQIRLALIIALGCCHLIAQDNADQTSNPNDFASTLTVLPRSAQSYVPFEVLERKGLKVILLRRSREWAYNNLLTPSELRFKPVNGRELVEGVAKLHDLKVVWLNGGKIAVIERGVSDAEVDTVLTDLKSTELSKRKPAIWKAQWLRDVRIVRSLVSAAENADEETKSQIIKGVHRINFDVVAGICGQSALPLFEKAVASTDATVRKDVAHALGHIGGEKALALIEKLMRDPDQNVARAATYSLGFLGDSALPSLESALGSQNVEIRTAAARTLRNLSGKKAQDLAEKALMDTDWHVQNCAVEVLGYLGGDRAVALIEKALDDPEPNPESVIRWTAASAMGQVGGDKDLLLLEKTLGDFSIGQNAFDSIGEIGGDTALTILENAMKASTVPERPIPLGSHPMSLAFMHEWAAEAIGTIGGERALDVLEHGLDKGDSSTRIGTATALGQIGNDKALSLLERLLKDPDRKVHCKAVEALGKIGNEKALALLEQAMDDPDENVRKEVVDVLGEIGNERALVLLEKGLGDKSQVVQSSAILSLCGLGSERALALAEKSLGKDNVRGKLPWVLGSVGGDCALRMLEKLTTSDFPYGCIQRDAIGWIGSIGEERAPKLLEKALSHPLIDVRKAAAEALGEVGGDTARDMLLSALNTEKETKVRESLKKALRDHFGNDPAVKKLFDRGFDF